MRNISKHTYTKINQDLSKQKFSPETYYSARNIRILTNSDFGAVTNNPGNEIVLTALQDTPSNPSTKSHLNDVNWQGDYTDIILGNTEINETLYLLVKRTYVNEQQEITFELFCIFKVDTIERDNTLQVFPNDVYGSKILFVDTIPVEVNKIDVIGFYENENIQKIYFADGVNELRFCNVADPSLINMDSKFLSTVPRVNLTQPKVQGFNSGGSSHTAGVIQYAYNLYKKNGAQTRISPLSNLVYLNNGDRGNQVNTLVEKSVNITLENLDTSFDRIKIYAVKYTSLNSTPEVRVISEQNVNTPVIRFTDDNNSTVSVITLPEFTLLGGEVYIPRHLKIKDNHLFLANYKTLTYDVDFDCRAYRFDVDGNLLLKGQSDITSTGFQIPSVPLDHDAINPTNKATEEDANWNKYIWKNAAGSGGNTTEVTATQFTQLFDFTSVLNTYQERYYKQDAEVFIDFDPEPNTFDYSTIRCENTTVVTVKHGLEIQSVNIVNASNPYTFPLCGASTPNSPGDNIIGIQINGDDIIFDTVGTVDSRCPGSEFPLVVTAEIILSDGTDTYTISVDVRNPYFDSPDAKVWIFNFQNPDGLTFTQSTVPTVDGELGGIGPNVEFTIKYRTERSNFNQSTMAPSPNLATSQNTVRNTSLKSGEVYRLFIEFLLDDGRYSFPKWVADVKIPEIGTINSEVPVGVNGNINYCYIETKLLNIPNDEKVKGWRTCIVERTDFDKTILTQGLFNPAISDNFLPNVDVFPSYVQRTVSNDEELAGININEDTKPNRFNTQLLNELNLSSNEDSPNNQLNREITSEDGRYTINNSAGNIYSPEAVAVKDNVNVQSVRIRKLGLLQNTFTTSFRQIFDLDGLVAQSVEGLSGNNLSRRLQSQGNRLLSGPLTNSDSKRVRMSKLISGNTDGQGEKVFEKRQHAYVKYFGGITLPRNQFNSSNNQDISGKVNYMAPIQNIYNFNNPDTNTTVSFATGANIPIFPKDDEPDGTVFTSFSGSNFSVVGINEDFFHNITELPAGDNNDYGVMVELYNTIPNQYGGDTYNARQLNRTIPYSNIVPIEQNSVTTEHQGDTFIQKFNCLKTFRSQDNTVQIAEIVSFPVETSINLDLRFDILKNRPDNYEADELTSYGFNEVYNQQNTTIRGIPKPFNFTELLDFPQNIIPSKPKFAGELIDSFTDFLVNDIKTLDGTHGEITGLGEFNDNIFSFQRTGIAYLAINPRVQLSATDGIPIELGSGRLIERYQYITTKAGTIHKWSIQSSTNGLMFYDYFNKAISFVGGEQGSTKLTTVNGLYNTLIDFSDNTVDIEKDNPILKQGVIAHYDRIKEDTYFTFFNKDTVCYNGLVQGFTSFYDFLPSHYISFKNRLITTNDNTSLYRHFNSKQSTIYYGELKPNSITLVSNDNPDVNKIFDNLHYNSEFYVGSNEDPKLTFTNLRLWNDYQDTLKQQLNTLLYRSSIKRRLRKWNIIIPRDTVTVRDRISNNWVFIELEFIPENNNTTFTLHDLLVSYTAKQ